MPIHHARYNFARLGGTLPVIQSKEEHEFLVKLSYDEMLPFIGLKAKWGKGGVKNCNGRYIYFVKYYIFSPIFQ